MSDNQWSAFLEDLVKDVPEGERKTFTFGEVVVQIMKIRDDSGIRFNVGITKSGEERACEGYWLEDGFGVYDCVYVYPALVEKPKAVTAYPADMTENQRKEWGTAYANSIVKFLGDLLDDVLFGR